MQYDQNISVKTMGFLKPQEISNLLLRVRFGFLESSTRMFAKSGVFAAYCAHGVIAISCRKFNGAEDGLKKGRDFICCDFEKNMEEDVFESISSAAYSWYSQHRLDKQVLTWVKLIEKASP